MRMRVSCTVCSAILGCLIVPSILFGQLQQVQIEDGMVQPQRPIGESITKAADFICLSDDGYTPGEMTEESTPGYLLSALVHADGSRHEPQIAYPARHHAYFIRAFLKLYTYAGDGSWLLRAQDLADWNIEHCTAADSDWPHIPWGTYNNATPGGGQDRDAVEPDKAAFIGIAFVELFEVTGQTKYLDMANRIADTLLAHQQPDGYWPFRVHPKHRYVMEWYGGAPVYYVHFFDNLNRHRRDRELARARQKVLEYMLETNIKQGLWGTYHEDVHPQRREYLSSEPICFTALWLLRNSQDHPGYIGAAWEALEQIHGVLVHYEDLPVSPAPAVAEQPGCNFVMPGHTARYCSVLAELYRLTGNQKYKRDALSGMNGTTYMQTDRGLFRTWIWDPHANKAASGVDWYSQHLYTVFHMLDTMPRLPELAPDDENHLLGGTVAMQSIRYADGSITYETRRAGQVVARLINEPAQVTLDDQPMPRVSRLSDDQSPMWTFDETCGVLKLKHPAGTVRIVLR